MDRLSTEQELNELLAESPADASFRVAAHLSLDETDALVLYGAGTLGRIVLEKLRRVGIQPVAFADDTPEKQGHIIEGLPVIAIQEVASKYGERAVFVVTILNPLLRFLEAKRRLQQQTGARVISFLSLAWKYPQVFLPYYQFELPQDVLAKAKDIRRAFHLFNDEESRRQFIGHLKFRLRLDYLALPANSWANYFPSDVSLSLPPDTTFVDCGAYDGDTIKFFLEQQGGQFREIFAFEPDELNCQKLHQYLSTLEAEAAQRIHIYNAGVGSRRTKMGFHQTGNMSAAFSHEGESEVDVLPLQEIVRVNGEFVFLKLDVEGAEWEALKGAERLLAQARPLLAISVYHRPDDLWQLPLYIESLGLGYGLFLRTQGEDGMDVICYAIPPRTPHN
jgi:FkbM family methyltransferase